MPSAANVKIDKPISSENSVTDANAASSTPIRQAITAIEHKIRNLEKRKAKLESYRELQNSGKDLNSDQKTAIAKYDEVVQTLEFARDLCKQYLVIAVTSEKEAKKQARKEALAKSQAELAKVREVLLVQDALTQMGNDAIREDFLQGRNGAAQLCESDLQLLDDLYTAVTPKHEPGDSQVFCTQIQAAAEHLLAVVDGKAKEVFGSTYAHIKDVIGKIHESGYFDQAQEHFVEAVEEEFVEAAVVDEVPIPDIVNHEVLVPEPMPVMETLTIEARATVVQQMAPVQAVEPPMVPMQEQPIYYAQQPLPQPRPLSDVIGTGSFSFLQESELDTPPEQIPTQTFTNQSFVQGPPPPIPMPPHFQTYGPGVPPQQMPPPPQQQPMPPQPQPIPQQQHQQQPVSPVVVPKMNNSIEENNHHDHQLNDMQKQRGRPRSNNNQQQQQQPFYANNNGYNNRPRQNRSGPRQGGGNNRHNQ